MCSALQFWQRAGSCFHLLHHSPACGCLVTLSVTHCQTEIDTKTNHNQIRKIYYMCVNALTQQWL